MNLCRRAASGTALRMCIKIACTAYLVYAFSSEKRSGSARSLRQLLQRSRSSARRLHPALGTMPVDEWADGIGGQLQRGRGRGHGQAPQAVVGSTLLKPGQAQVATGAPVCCNGLGIQALSAQAQAGGLYGGTGTAQTQIQRAAAAFFLQPVTGVQRQRLAAPLVEPLQRLLLAAVVKAQRGLGRGHRQHLEADLGNQAQRAPAACHQARDVIARHVLHDLAAIAQHFALAVDHLQPQYKVAHGTHIGA